MSLRLMLQDPALRALPKVLPAAVVTALLMRAWPEARSAIDGLRDGGPPSGYMPMLVLLTLLGLLWLVNCNTWARCGRLHLGLPLTARRLWLVRMLSIIGCGIAPVLAIGLVIGLRVELDPLRMWVVPEVAWAALQVAGVLAVAAVLFQAPLLDRYRLAASSEYVVYCLAVGACLLAIAGAKVPEAGWVVVLFVVAATIGTVLYARLPLAFSVADRPALFDDAELRSRAAAPTRWRERPEALVPGSAPARWLLRRTVFRSLTHHALFWILWLCVFGYSFMWVEVFLDGRSFPLALVLVMWWHPPMFQLAMARMDALDPLPIARRLLFALVAGAVVIAVVAGAVLAGVSAALKGDRRAQVRYQEGTVRIPEDLHEVVRAGEVPVVRSPWGETSQPRFLALVDGLQFGVYNPYETAPESSPRFVEWQLRRAVGAIDGRPVTVPRDDDPSIAGGIERGQFTPAFARGGWPGRRLRTAAAFLILATALVAVVMSLYLMRFSPGPRHRLFRWAYGSMLAAFGVVVGGAFAVELFGLGRMAAVEILVSVGIRELAGLVPLPGWALWLVAAAVGVAGFAVVRDRFERLEAPGRAILKPYAEDY